MKQIAACVFLMTTILGTPALAQMAEPSFKGDPDVYKLIYEDDKIRIIESIRKVGVTDKAHGHPVKSVVYGVTDCKTTQTANGKSVEGPLITAGTARAIPVVESHTATNAGTADCKQLFIEEK